MDVDIRVEPDVNLNAYSRVPIMFTVERILDVHHDEGIGFVVTEKTVQHPYVKDYDAQDGGPQKWPEQFDLTEWIFLAAFSAGGRVGGAAIAVETPGVSMLGGRSDLAVLWDIRVSPEFRGFGVGSALFRAVELAAIERDCRELKVETQDTNVPAVRFYQSHGCQLRSVHRHAYSRLPNEVQLLLYKDLAPLAP